MGAHVPVQRRALGRAVEARTSVAAAAFDRRRRQGNMRGPRPHHHGMPARPCSVAASGQPALGGRRGTTPRKACSAPTGRRFPSCSCRSPHPRPTQAHFASMHGTPPQDPPLSAHNHEDLPRVTAPAPGPFTSATSPPGPSGETVPELRTRAGSPILTKLACKPFHKRA